MLSYTALFDQGKGLLLSHAFVGISLADAAFSLGVAGLRASSLISSPFCLGGEGSRPVCCIRSSIPS